MTPLASHRASFALLLALGPAAACVQTTDFQETDVESDTGPEPSTAVPGTGGSGESDGSEGPGQTSGEVPQEPGDPLWVRLWPSGDAVFLYGLGLAADGGVIASGGLSEDFKKFGVLWSSTPAGDLVEEQVELGLEMPLWDLCMRPDGGAFAVGLNAGSTLDGLGDILRVVDIDPSGDLVAQHPYAGTLVDDYQSSAVLPRVVCDADGQVWVVMSYDSTESEAGMTVTKTLTARFDSSGFTGWERLFEEGAGTFEGLIGAGGDAAGGLHVPVVVEAPAGDEYQLLWHRFDAAGEALPDRVLGSESFFGDNPHMLLFAASGQRVAIVGYDSTTDRNWMVVTDPDGNEQWRTDQLPPPSEPWLPRAVALGEDGGVVIAAWSGHQPDQILSLVTFEPGGVLAWSHSYEDYGDPMLAPEHMVIGAVQMNPDTIDVVGSVWQDPRGDRVDGWVRRVLR